MLLKSFDNVIASNSMTTLLTLIFNVLYGEIAFQLLPNYFFFSFVEDFYLKVKTLTVVLGDS